VSVSLREQVPDYMEDLAERFISASGWCPWCEQPHVDGRYPGEITLMFAPFFDMDMSYTRVLHIKVAYRVPHE
jgi:hypothetical protein